MPGKEALVTAIVVIIVTVAVLVGIGAALGGVALAVLVAIAAVVLLGWLLSLAVSRRSPRQEISARSEDREFLGPGGPDDPTS
jgi:heme A synthase